MLLIHSIDDVTWEGKDIKVMEQVTIRPPYLPENIVGNAEKAVNHVKKIVSDVFHLSLLVSKILSLIFIGGKTG